MGVLFVRKLLFAVLLLVVGVVGLGVYLDWFRFSTSGTQGSGPVGVGVTVDRDKIKDDAEKAKEKAKGLGEKAQEKVEAAKTQGTAPPK
jgi:hypothetical protein